MSKEMEIKQECCDIWNNLKDKTKMIDYLIESKQQVADLEAKLAESKTDKELLKKQLNEQIWLCEEKQQTIDEINKEFTKAVKDWKHLVKIEKTEKEQLKQQLAEKEKEIESLKIDLEAKDFNINSLMEQRTRKQKFYNQDKISFCIDKLEKVKEKIQEDRESLINYNNASEVLMADAFLCDCKNFIDNQIEELKKEMK